MNKKELQGLQLLYMVVDLQGLGRRITKMR